MVRAVVALLSLVARKVSSTDRFVQVWLLVMGLLEGDVVVVDSLLYCFRVAWLLAQLAGPALDISSEKIPLS